MNERYNNLNCYFIRDRETIKVVQLFDFKTNKLISFFNFILVIFITKLNDTLRDYSALKNTTNSANLTQNIRFIGELPCHVHVVILCINITCLEPYEATLHLYECITSGLLYKC